MRVGLAIIVVVGVAAGCAERRAPAVEDAGEASDTPAREDVQDTPHVDNGPSLAMLGSEHDHDAILERIRTARAVRFKPVGSTSIVYQMLLEGDVNAAFKPRSRQHPHGDRAEVGAYRIARFLQLDSVPPAITRRVHRDVLHARLHPDFEDAWPEIVSQTLWDDDDMVTGTAIYWIPQMRGLGLEERGRMGQWTRSLKQDGTVATERIELHRDLSNMIALDYLVANWDRWSGGNAQGMPDGGRLFIRDHNVAFPAPLPENLHERVRNHLLRTEKFSRSFIQRLRELNDPTLRAQLARDPDAADHPALTSRQIRDVMGRRAALLSYVGSLVEQYGEERVLVFQ